MESIKKHIFSSASVSIAQSSKAILHRKIYSSQKSDSRTFLLSYFLHCFNFQQHTLNGVGYYIMFLFILGICFTFI